MSYHPRPLSLCPEVRFSTQEHVFEVRSRSENRWWLVNAGDRHGLMSCLCKDHRKNKNDCYHIQQVRKLISCLTIQKQLYESERRMENVSNPG